MWYWGAGRWWILETKQETKPYRKNYIRAKVKILALWRALGQVSHGRGDRVEEDIFKKPTKTNV